MSKEWTLQELAAETGVPERTIRFYISRELLDPPLRAGRGAAYGEKHKARLEDIRRLQAKGMMLAEIAHALALEGAGAADRSNSYMRPLFKMDRIELERPDYDAVEPVRGLPEPELWRAYTVADDVVVMLRRESGPWRTRKVLAALRAFAAVVEEDVKKEDKGE